MPGSQDTPSECPPSCAPSRGPDGTGTAGSCVEVSPPEPPLRRLSPFIRAFDRMHSWTRDKNALGSYGRPLLTRRRATSTKGATRLSGSTTTEPRASEATGIAGAMITNGLTASYVAGPTFVTRYHYCTAILQVSGAQRVGGWGSALGRYMRAFDSLWGQRHRPDVGYVLGYGDYGLGWSCRGGGRLKFRKLFEVPIPCFYP